MIQLIYLSYSSKQFQGKTDIDSILDKAQTVNPKLDITGMLLFRAGVFLQLLEGPEHNVKTLYQKICQDPRHQDISTLIEQECEERLFEKWSMAYRELYDKDLLDVNKIYSWDKLLQEVNQKKKIQEDILKKILINFRFKII